jgi:hypothetical protein
MSSFLKTLKTEPTKKAYNCAGFDDASKNFTAEFLAPASEVAGGHTFPF